LERATVLRGGKSGGTRARNFALRATEHLRDFCAGQYWRYRENEIDETSRPRNAATFDNINEWTDRAVHHIENIEFYFADCDTEILGVTERQQGKILCDNEKGAGAKKRIVELKHQASDDQSRRLLGILSGSLG
jgi:hypothetical protein